MNVWGLQHGMGQHGMAWDHDACKSTQRQAPRDDHTRTSNKDRITTASNEYTESHAKVM